MHLCSYLSEGFSLLFVSRYGISIMAKRCIERSFHLVTFGPKSGNIKQNFLASDTSLLKLDVRWTRVNRIMLCPWNTKDTWFTVAAQSSSRWAAAKHEASTSSLLVGNVVKRFYENGRLGSFVEVTTAMNQSVRLMKLWTPTLLRRHWMPSRY